MEPQLRRRRRFCREVAGQVHRQPERQPAGLARRRGDGAFRRCGGRRRGAPGAGRRAPGRALQPALLRTIDRRELRRQGGLRQAMRHLCAALAAFAFGLAAMCVAAPALADITVDVNQAAVQPLPIAITTFAGSPVGAQISGVVAADLARSGLFRPLDAASFREQPNVSVTPTFDSWKAISAQALLVGAVSTGADGRLSVDFRLWDVYAGDQLVGTRLTATPDSWRTIAHQIADQVYEKLTGERGYFDTRVVFVAESGPKTHRVTRLVMMDQDGANPSYLPTDPTAMVFAPRFSAKRQEITYMVVKPTGSAIYLKNLDTGRDEVLG